MDDDRVVLEVAHPITRECFVRLRADGRCEVNYDSLEFVPMQNKQASDRAEDPPENCQWVLSANSLREETEGK